LTVSDRCKELRVRLWAGEAEPELASHLASCEACAALAARRAALGRALGALPRVALPSALDGAVVASLHAGHREARALFALGRVSRHSAPEELARRVDDELPLGAERGVPAPSVLERLVDEDLRDPARALARRFAGKLSRLSAPACLEQRVAVALARSQAEASRVLASTERSRRIALAGAALALLLLVWAAAPWRALRAPAEPGARIEIVRAHSLDDLGPTARALVDGLAGGLLSAPGEASSDRLDGRPR
jgi:hypothetical protein